MRRLLRWARERRSAMLELAGFGLLTGAAFQVDLTWGLVAAGASCLILGYTTSKPWPPGRAER